METNPYVSPQCDPKPLAPALRSGAIFKAWLVFIILFFVGSFLAGAFIGGVIGAILGTNGAPVDRIRLYAQMAGFLVSLPVSYLCFHFSVKAFIVPR